MLRSRTPLVAALCALLLPAALMAQSSGDILPFKASEKTLPNGLKVIVIPTGFPNIVSLQIPVQTGSRNEVEPGKSGFAHFFEHMMFRGTKAYPPDVYNAIITKAGARQNAFTSDDITNYHVTFAKEDLEKILEIEADRFKNLSYSEAAFKTEARAVLGRVQQELGESDQQARRSAARGGVHHAHLQAHHDGLHQRRRGHAEPVRILEDLLRPLVPAGERDRHRRRRRRDEPRLPARREILERLEAGQRESRSPAGAARDQAGLHACGVADGRPFPGSPSPSTVPRSSRARTPRRSRPCSISSSARPPTSTSASCRTSRKSTPSSATGVRAGIRRWSPSTRASRT